MKTKDISKQYSLDNSAFDDWVRKQKYKFKETLWNGIDIDDQHNSKDIVDLFQETLTQQQKRIAEEDSRLAQEQADIEKAAQQKQAALASILITSGFNFDGYTITKYSGYISGDDAVQIDRGTSGIFSRATDVGATLMASLVKIRRNALAEIKEAAYALGCNAVIGVDFDYLTLDPQTATSSGGTMYLPYVFGVTANGNAVIIEKNN